MTAGGGRSYAPPRSIELISQLSDRTLVSRQAAARASRAAKPQRPIARRSRRWLPNGGLLSYGGDSVDLFRRAAAYADRILRGDKPSELPVQAPVKFELVINHKTATSMGLTIPTSVLVAATEVVE